jgi:hypothetical protein
MDSDLLAVMSPRSTRFAFGLPLRDGEPGVRRLHQRDHASKQAARIRKPVANIPWTCSEGGFS